MNETLREAEAKAWDSLRLPIGECSGCMRRAHHDGFKAGMEYAGRTPGPATRVVLGYARDITETAMKMDRGQGFDRDAGRMVEDMKAFIAEHEPAGPAQSA